MNGSKTKEIELLIKKHPCSGIVHMIKHAYLYGNPYIPRKEFIDKFFRDDYLYNRFNKAKVSLRPDRPNITLGRSQSIIMNEEGFCRVNPLHVFVYSKLIRLEEASLLLDFSKQND